MKFASLTTLTLLLLILFTSTTTPDPYDYEAAWKEVRQLQDQQLPQSALQKVEEIYAAAQVEGNQPQWAKAIYYRGVLTLQTREDGMEATILLYEEAMRSIKRPWLNILESQLAGLYLNYFQQNRYAISQRTSLDLSEDKQVSSMSSQAFLVTIHRLLVQSLSEKSLLDRSVEQFNEVLQPGWNEAGLARRPTLHIVLAAQYLDYLQQGELRPTLPADRFFLNEDIVFASKQEFINHQFETSDSASFIFNSLALFQEVLSLTEDGSTADVHYDLQRLQFARQHFSGADPQQLYMAALESLAAKARPTGIYGEVVAAWAQVLAASEHYTDKARAVEMCEEAMAAWPESQGAYQCRQLVAEWRQPFLEITARQVYTPEEGIRLESRYRNLNHLTCKVYQIDPDKLRSISAQPYEAIPAIIAGGKLFREWHTGLNDSLYIIHEQTIRTNKLPVGTYVVIASTTDSVEAYVPFQVSNLTIVYSQEKTQGGYVLDRTSGAPIHKAKVNLYTQEWDIRSRTRSRKKVRSYVTDAKGAFPLTGIDKPVLAEVIFKKDRFDADEHLYTGHHEQKPINAIELYTDRAIYRPGQEVFFKGLCLQYDQEMIPGAAKNSKVEITLRDANYQEVGKLSLRSNEFGSFSGKFTLPRGQLSGIYHLQTNLGTKSFRVEEYKRPTFEINFDKMSRAVSLGEDMDVSGEARGLAGYTISHAEVRYEVYRQLYYPRWCWLPPYGAEREMIDAGSTRTDEKGAFNLRFPTRRLDTHSIRGVTYAYTVEVTITDPSGETREQKHNVNLLDTDYTLQLAVPPIMDLSDVLMVRVHAARADGSSQEVSGHVHIIRMSPSPEKKLTPDYNQPYYRGGNTLTDWSEKDTVRTLSFSAQKDLELGALPVGVYKLVALSNDSGGREVLDIAYLSVTDRKKGRYPASQSVFVQVEKEKYAPGELVRIQFGLSNPEGQVYYLLNRGGKILQQGWLRVRKSAEISYLVTEADRGGLSLSYFHVKNNEAHTDAELITVPWTNKELDIVYETFRDKTLPGADESYHIRISPREGAAQEAELLMSMYDASLDQFVPHSWRSSFYPSRFTRSHFRSLGFGIHSQQQYSSPKVDLETPAPVLLPYLLTFQDQWARSWGTDRMMDAMRMRAGGKEMSAAMTPDDSALEVEVRDARGKSDEANMEGDPGDDIGTTMETQAPPIPPRTVLNETVFFFPEIRTVKDGTITVSFKMNEALTRWRLMTLAHTTDFKVGYDERTVTTSKDLMILPNSPRFIKTGDELWFSARVANMSDRDLPYKAAIALMDDLTETPLDAYVLDAETAEGLIPSGQTIGVRWLLKIPDEAGVDLLRYTVSVRSGQQADAEQNVLPVQSNLVAVIETKTLFIRGGQTRDFSFEALKKADDPDRINKLFTVEYTANPVWQAIQALPYITPASDISTTSLVNRYFAHKLGLDIIQKHPLIERVFRQWDVEGGDVLKSRLLQNEELKATLLKETPWVLNALSESTQKSAIAAFFNTNMLQNELRMIATRLSERQAPNGGFVWTPGGRESEYITNYVLSELGQLQRLGLEIDVPSATLKRGLDYLDMMVAEHHQKLLKHNSKPDEYVPDAFIISVLYTRTHYPAYKPATEPAAAFAFYTRQAAKYWTRLDIYSQALLGRVLYRENNTGWQAIQRSLMERSFFAEERGRYFNVGNGYHWHELPIERHTAVLDFLEEVGTDVDFLNEMKIWLLSHKRVNRWHTTKATTAAIYSLLEKGPRRESSLELATRSRILVGGQDLRVSDQAETATGYFKRQWQPAELTPSLGMVRIQNNADHVSWGGLYYQYITAGSRVEAHQEGPLKLQKQLYKVVTGREGERLERITEATPLVVGDELVSRVILEIDRDMQFVELRDMRGAGIEPVLVLSGYRWEGGLGYYHSIRDMADYFFIQSLRKGTYVLENRQRVVHRGRYDAGIATIQSSYAPEFSAHSQGFMIEVR